MENECAIKPTRIDFSRISMDKLNLILSTGSLDSLSEPTFT